VSVASTTIVDDERNIQLKLGEQVCADFSSASRDPHKFSEPEKVKLDRPEESYLHLWTGPHSGLGGPIVLTAAATMLKSVAALKNLHRVSGKAGDSTTKTIGGAVKVYLTTDASAWSSLPQSESS
jgi:cytochrome P450